VTPRRWTTLGWSALYLAAVIVWLIPVWWMFDTAFKPEAYIFKRPPTWWSPEWTFRHFREVIAEWPFLRWIVNSIVVAAGATAMSMVLSIPAAYSFARIRWRGRNVLFFVMIASMLIHAMSAPLSNTETQIATAQRRASSPFDCEVPLATALSSLFQPLLQRLDSSRLRSRSR
jgi:ABC-type glycerol-3-phosphate transport system permease component